MMSFQTLLTMTLLANANANSKYLGNISQFNSSNCSIPFYNFTYLFDCMDSLNTTECCRYEYSQLNMSFGNEKCARYEQNDTFMVFECGLPEHNSTGGSSRFSKDFYKGLISGVVAVVALFITFMIIRCIACSKRKEYHNL